MDELGLQDPGAEHQFTMGLTITLSTSLAADGLSLGTAGEICPLLCWKWQQATFLAQLGDLQPPRCCLHLRAFLIGFEHLLLCHVQQVMSGGFLGLTPEQV